MARIVKITWPATGKPYRGFITKFRQCLDEVYDFLNHSPQAKQEIRDNFEAFAVAAALPDAELPDTSVVVSDGDMLSTVDGGTVAVTVTGGIATYTYTAP